MNKLYLLRPVGYTDSFEAGAWSPWYDKAFGYVICAASPNEAREIASKQRGGYDENLYKAWLDPFKSSCVELKPTEKTGIIIEDFRAA